MKLKLFFAFLALLLAAAPAVADSAAAPAAAPKVLLVASGELPGTEFSAADREAARQHLETLLGRQLAEQFGLRLTDPETVAKARADAEKWAVLTGGDLASLRQALAEYQPDFFIRASFRTSEPRQESFGDAATGISTFWSCTADVTLEILPRGAAAAFTVAAPPMTTPKKRLKPLETALVALEEAAAGLPGRLRARQIFAAPETAPKAAATLTGKKVIFVVSGTLDGTGLPDTAKARAAAQVEADLAARLARAYAIQHFEEEALAKARKNAEQWAVLTGGDVDAVRAALEPYALDFCLRVKFHAPAPLVRETAAGRVFSGTALVSLEVINLRAARGTKALVVESPPMGTNEHPAILALEPASAATAALADCADRILDRLTSGGAPATVAAAVPPVAKSARPTVAVLWVRPEFKGWTVPRSRQPGLGARHQRQVNEFVRQAKASGEIGLQVNDWLVEALAAGGGFVPVERSGRTAAEIAGLRNKLLEWRMAGWVGEKLGYSDPVAAARAVAAEWGATARITKIAEPQPAAAAGPFANVSRAELKAWAEVTVTEARTGRTLTATGEGTAAREGWGTGVSYVAGLKLDQTLLGLAIRQALQEAAGRLQP
ncbi:MAG: hypothetical protein WC789_01360 [Lentisphaeria bacterium]|jgi:hypothetical protein